MKVINHNSVPRRNELLSTLCGVVKEITKTDLSSVGLGEANAHRVSPLHRRDNKMSHHRYKRTRPGRGSVQSPSKPSIMRLNLPSRLLFLWIAAVAAASAENQTSVACFQGGANDTSLAEWTQDGLKYPTDFATVAAAIGKLFSEEAGFILGRP